MKLVQVHHSVSANYDSKARAVRRHFCPLLIAAAMPSVKDTFERSFWLKTIVPSAVNEEGPNFPPVAWTTPGRGTVSTGCDHDPLAHLWGCCCWTRRLSGCFLCLALFSFPSRDPRSGLGDVCRDCC